MPAWSVEEVQRIVITTVNYSPVVLVTLIVSWSFLAYDFSLCGGLLKDDHVLRGILYFLIFQPIVFIMTWSYIKAVRTLPGYTSDDIGQFDETAEDLETGQTIVLSQSIEGEVASQPLLQRVSQPSSVTVKRDGRSRFCQKCYLPKHDRAHHCRTCKKCVLKMDHHCPWLNNCIGFHNQKYFYLFLVYSSLYSIVIFATALPETIRVWNSPMGILALDLNWPFLVLFSGLFGIFLIPFTIFHTNQLMTNRTTIESYERSNYIMGSRRNRDVLTSRFFNAWNLGVKENVVQVLGRDQLRWFIPVGKPQHVYSRQGDGRSFPINSYAYDTLVEEEEEV